MELGLPHSRSDESPDEQKVWTQLEAAADQKVLASFPQLADPPAHYHKPVKLTPYRLYKHVAPLCDADDTTGSRSIVSSLDRFA